LNRKHIDAWAFIIHHPTTVAKTTHNNVINAKRVIITIAKGLYLDRRLGNLRLISCVST